MLFRSCRGSELSFCYYFVILLRLLHFFNNTTQNTSKRCKAFDKMADFGGKQKMTVTKEKSECMQRHLGGS